ncbi:LacI family DNA-binding transcriptional regulator [Photobacterium sp. DNB22_13_2]
MNKKVTASDVAEHVGVSRSAVSRAFTEGASISAAKRDEILLAAQQLGYQPNFFARTLSTPAQKARSHLVAILISDFSNPFQSYLFETLSSVLQKHGKQPMLLNVKQAEDLDAALMRLSGYQVDGVIAVMGSLPIESVAQCQKLSLPLVTLGRSDPAGQHPSVQTDNRLAGQLAAHYFIEKGFSRVGFVAGRADGQASTERFQGFIDTLYKHGIDKVARLEAGRYGYSAGYQITQKEQSTLRLLQGVFCASDALALGLMDCCRQDISLTIPNQLSVVGCDNVPQSDWEGYQLTTVAQPVLEIAEQAYRCLEEVWQGKAEVNMVVRIKPTLVQRKS